MPSPGCFWPTFATWSASCADSGPVDVAESIRRLVPAGGTLAVHLELPSSLGALENDRAEAIVRCAQE